MHHLDDVLITLPGRIETYDAAKQLAEVRVCLKRRTPTEDGDVIIEEWPVIPNVPVEHNQTTGFFMSFPVAAGDFVWLHFSSRSLNQWMANGGVAADDPIDRRFNAKDCFAVLARNPASALSQTANDAIVIGGKGALDVRSYFKASVVNLGGASPTSFIALADNVATELSKIATSLTQVATLLNVAGPVVGAPGTVTPYTVPGNVAATKVKAV